MAATASGLRCEGGGDAEDRHRHVAFGEHPPEPPEAGAGAVFVDQFHAHVALAGPGRGADDLGQESLRGAVPVQDVVLAALLVIDHELHADPRIAGPMRMGRIAAVADRDRADRKVAHVSCPDRSNSSRASPEAARDNDRPARRSRTGRHRVEERRLGGRLRAAEIGAHMKHELVGSNMKGVACEKRRIGASVSVRPHRDAPAAGVSALDGEEARSRRRSPAGRAHCRGRGWITVP